MGYTFQQRKNRQYVSSMIIYFIEYDRDTSLLKIGFNDGLIGYYKDVPGDLISEFKSAVSKGDFFYKKLYNGEFENHIESV